MRQTIGHYSHSPPAMRVCLLAFLLWHSVSPSPADPTVRPSCPATDDICEFNLVLSHNSTMVYAPLGPSGLHHLVRFNEDRELLMMDRDNCSLFEPFPMEAQEQVVTADGFSTNVMTYNGLLPGPQIVVYEGQQVVIHLRNALVSEATTLHFHGIHQLNTPWMDGAGFTSQCPINAGETFTYRFLAEPEGTHWYHSHYGTQRQMGAYGPLIVLPKDRHKNRRNHPLPKFAAEYILQVSEWNGIQFEQSEIPNSQCFKSTKQSDGFDSAVMPFSAGLINGKGRRYDPVNDTIAQRLAPLEVFKVKKGFRYRFRMICASALISFRVSIDGHPLHVIATDGRDVISKQVESIIISSGERFDFWIDTSDPDHHGKYWVRAETLERFHLGKPIKPHHVDAILQYDKSSHGEPRSRRRECTSKDTCDVINCPFRAFDPIEHLNCVLLTDLKLLSGDTTYSSDDDDDILEYFLNYHYAFGKMWGSTINGIQHVHPVAPPQVYPKDIHQYITPCVREECRKTLCQCTHKLEIPLGKVVQLVLATTIDNADELDGLSHQIHLHGYGFQVIKMAFPIYNNVTGFFEAMNSDLKCDEDSDYCNNLQWTDPSWQSGNVPGIVKRGAPVKDTVVVPVGGYVVVRFRATNPGFWFMHCHTYIHNEEGMSMFLQVGNISEMNAAPEHMTTCGNSPFTSEEFIARLNNPVNPVAVGDAPREIVNLLMWTVFALAVVCFLLLATNIFLCRQKARQGYTRIPYSADS